MKDRLILLVGASGSGKTTIAKELEKEGYNIIHSFTTRPEREPNEWGHIFIKNYWSSSNIETDELDALHDNTTGVLYTKDDMTAHFNSYNSGNHYFATKDQYQGKGTSIYVIDPSGAEQVRANVKDAEIVTIFLMADKDTRRERMVKSRKQYLVTDRLRADFKIFSKCKCDYVVDGNRELPEVVADIKEIIGGM